MRLRLDFIPKLQLPLWQIVMVLLLLTVIGSALAFAAARSDRQEQG